MKKHLPGLLISVLLVAPLSLPATETGGAVQVRVSEAGSSRGQVCVALYNNPDAFPEPGRHYRFACRPISDGKSTVSFKNLPSGSYAVFAFHDADSNRKMKTNWLGIPREGVGASRGAKGKFGPPKFKDASFQVNSGIRKVPIRLVYI